ncbi:MAG: Pimeloyl-ACP methyl ester carboxylesterase [Microbacteriaceae bacterium]|nr:Pimeloyl-ACP methyl ester carboxylesterase [Microbacteriaceae bacterium]
MTDAPTWFTAALARRPDLGETTVDGTRIAYRSWGESGSGSDVLLVHGGAAHARWWDAIAPLLAAGRRVVAVDLSGHGDSEHASAYSLDGWADQLAAVMDAAALRRPVLVGHSLGGIVSTVLAMRGVPVLDGLVVVDSPIEPTGPESRAEADSPVFGRGRVYATAEEASARFRPVPAQESLPYTEAYIAANSVREIAGGWGWKFDPAFSTMTGDLPRTLDGLPCPVVFVAGERGILSPESRAALDASTEVAVVEIPGAGHAMMLDEPVALAAALRGILAGWATAR